MATPKKPASKKPMSKDSNSKTKGPASIEKQAIKDFASTIDSTMETYEKFGGAVRKQAQSMLNKYNVYAKNVSGKEATQANRDYDKLFRLRQAEERKQAVPKQMISQKKRPKSTDAAGRSGFGAGKSTAKKK